MTDEELIARLRGDHPDYLTSAAADRIEALVNELDELQHRVELAEEVAGIFRRQRIYAEAEVARLRGELAHEPDYPDTIWQEASAALKGEDHE